MKTALIIISALTAFCIAAGGALGVVLVGGAPTKWQIVAAIILGVVVAAKDTRSLLKLPPVDADNKPNP
jgi:hypothetical protein